MGCPGQDDQGSLDTGALSLVQEETAVLADFAQGVRRAREKVLREAQAGGGGRGCRDKEGNQSKWCPVCQ